MEDNEITERVIGCAIKVHKTLGFKSALSVDNITMSSMVKNYE